MSPVLAAALARAEAADAFPSDADASPLAPDAAPPRRASTTRRVAGHLFGVFWTLDGLRPERKGER